MKNLFLFPLCLCVFFWLFFLLVLPSSSSLFAVNFGINRAIATHTHSASGCPIANRNKLRALEMENVVEKQRAYVTNIPPSIKIDGVNCPTLGTDHILLINNFLYKIKYRFSFVFYPSINRSFYFLVF